MRAIGFSPEVRAAVIQELTQIAAWVRSGQYAVDDARDEIARAVENRVRTYAGGKEVAMALPWVLGPPPIPADLSQPSNVKYVIRVGKFGFFVVIFDAWQSQGGDGPIWECPGWRSFTAREITHHFIATEPI